MKGVILAGGTGSRLHPLTRITNKHLLPIYDRPMVTYAIETLVSAGITELMVVTGGTHAGEFLRLLGNGHEYGIDRLLYAYQERPGGIAEALGLTERFVDGDRVVVMLADNVVERSLRPAVANFLAQESGAAEETGGAIKGRDRGGAPRPAAQAKRNRKRAAKGVPGREAFLCGGDGGVGLRADTALGWRGARPEGTAVQIGLAGDAGRLGSARRRAGHLCHV